MTTKLLVISLVSMLLVLSVFAKPEVVTRVKVSAFGIDDLGVVTPVVYIWNTNAGIWNVDGSGVLVLSTNDYFDFWWNEDTNTAEIYYLR